MASTNQSLAYQKAQGRFLTAETNEEKLLALEEMIKECPKHKSSENMLANLRTRRKKLETQIVKSRKSRGKTIGIKKGEMQIVIIGDTNTGKSSLLSILTNTCPLIAEYEFTTKKPNIGIMNYKNIPMQIIENPPIESEEYDKGLTNTTDTLIILITNLDQIEKINQKIEKAKGKKIIVFNKIDELDQNQIRKISATLQSKKHNFVLISIKTNKGIEELKNKIFQSFDKIRIFTKEPGKDKSPKPIIMKQNSTVKDVAEKILKGLYKNIKQTKIWGPSSKFPGQKIGLKHALKDLDIVEFKTR